jgi:hypothetical protein
MFRRNVSSTLKMEAIRSSETSGITQWTTRRHIPEDDTLNGTMFGNLDRWETAHIMTSDVQMDPESDSGCRQCSGGWKGDPALYSGKARCSLWAPLQDNVWMRFTICGSPCLHLFVFWHVLFFNPEDGGSTFVWKFSELRLGRMASHPTRWHILHGHYWERHV